MGLDVERPYQETLSKWLQLSSIPNFGVASLRKVQRKTQWTIDELLTAATPDLQTVGFNAKQIEAIKQADEVLSEVSLVWLDKQPGGFLIPIDDPRYPPLLKEISSPPMLLFGYGNVGQLSTKQLAMVGSRNPSMSGKATARTFAQQLSQMGWTITSGLAAGIDGLSHEGALLNKGVTVAVLGTAIDNIYPKKHAGLAEKIVNENGVIVSEFAPSTPSKPENFPRRNRIISGLSKGVLVVEAAIKSGSLITARYAMEQNREVFAIPGNINNPLSKGCHYLIQQGAKLVSEVADINNEFPALEMDILHTKQNKTQNNCTESLATDLLLDSVDFEATPLDIVAERSGIPVSQVMSQLLDYELRGLVAAVPGGYIKLGEK